jgi:hydroxymethylpyrimidine/phosphomethylpyrimidine kinase
MNLLPMTTILTPNIPEAQLLLSDAGQVMKEPQCVDDLVEIAKAVQALGPEYVLVKGGHVPFNNDGKIASREAERKIIVDVLYGSGKLIRVESVYQKSRNTHGTGCSLACEQPPVF